MDIVRRNGLMLLLAAATTAAAYPTAAEVIRVPQDQPTIQRGIDVAQNGDTVLVADGVYTGIGNRDVDFRGKAITVESENGADACTVDCQRLGRAFIFQSGETRDAVLRGFSIINGDTGARRELGGGVTCFNNASPTIEGCVFDANTAGIYNGGALYCGPGSSALVRGCAFRRSTSGGGAVFCDRGAARFEHCTIEENTCGIGGGVFCSNAAPVFFNCLIVNNVATDGNYGGGGVMLNAGANPEFYNCTISGNRANLGGAFFLNRDSNLVIQDCILWNDVPNEIQIAQGTPDVTYSDVEGGWPGEGNIDQDPLFVVGPFGGYYLSQRSAGEPQDSPCVDAGSDTSQAIGLDDRTTRTDQVGDAGLVDMGYHHPTGGGPGQCDLIRKVKASCKGRQAPFKIKAKVKSSLPEGTVLTLVLDGDRKAAAVVDRRGKARATFRNVEAGAHEVCLRECPGDCGQTDC